MLKVMLHEYDSQRRFLTQHSCATLLRHCFEWLQIVPTLLSEFCRKKNMKIQSGREKMRNASGQQGVNEGQRKIKANTNTGNKILGKHIQQFLHKNNA